MPSRRHLTASNLTNAFLAGEWAEEPMVERGDRACAGRGRWLRPLVRRVLAEFHGSARPSYPTLLRFLKTDTGFRDYCPSQPGHTIWSAEKMMPAAGPPETWNLPSIITLNGLAEWLSVTHSQLDWFADLSRRNRKSGPHLQHYEYRWLPGRNNKLRLLEMPKGRLKAIQRRILNAILSQIPPHESAHAYRSGRSIVTFATPHANREIVLAMDLRAFFPSVSLAMVRAIFRTTGYPDTVARVLAGLCTSDVPEAVLRTSPIIDRADWYHTAAKLREAHLPQGAPTSPALANLAGYRLDLRLSGLARSVGAAYSRYADDLAFSGNDEFRRCLRPFRRCVTRIVIEEGFDVNETKSRLMSPATRQQLCGVVVNDRPNVSRPLFDELKAILTNCLRNGARSENITFEPDFRSHLAGRIAHVAMLNPNRGQKLRVLFDQIQWDS